jgi:carbon monoxide dehydrogenase subunit G
MKYTVEIIINQPIDQVIALFDNPKNMNQWMEGLQSFKHLSGVQGQPGAKSELKFLMGKKEVEMIETILVRNLPDEFTGTYEAKGVYNLVKNKFVKISDTQTKYISENEFQLTGVMKIVGSLMPGMFKSQSMKYLTAFKNFAEKA